MEMKLHDSQFGPIVRGDQSDDKRTNERGGATPVHTHLFRRTLESQLASAWTARGPKKHTARQLQLSVREKIKRVSFRWWDCGILCARVFEASLPISLCHLSRAPSVIVGDNAGIVSTTVSRRGNKECTCELTSNITTRRGYTPAPFQPISRCSCFGTLLAMQYTQHHTHTHKKKHTHTLTENLRTV